MEKERRICECGCKETFECSLDSPQRFIWGHNRRGKKNGKYQKEVVSKRMQGNKNPMKNSIILEKMRESKKNQVLTEDHKNNIRLGVLRSYAGKSEEWKKTKDENISKARLKSIPVPSNKRYRGYFREDLNQYFRSSWDADIARILNYLNISWEYEKHSFSVALEEGMRSYRPDFYLKDFDLILEIKGYERPNSMKKIKSFKLQYSELPFLLLSEKIFYVIAKNFSFIPNLENVKPCRDCTPDIRKDNETVRTIQKCIEMSRNASSTKLIEILTGYKK